MLGAAVRSLLVLGGLLLMAGGLLSMISVDAGGGLSLVIPGGIIVGLVAIERGRYRSAAAERAGLGPGPGGGEGPGEPLDGRFRPTAEVFIDPVGGQRMRVLVDPATGERRYQAEG